MVGRFSSVWIPIVCLRNRNDRASKLETTKYNISELDIYHVRILTAASTDDHVGDHDI